jgi:hypothetical protein
MSPFNSPTACHRLPHIISRPLPNSVTYDLTNTPHDVRITLPRGSTWTSGLHWHETHDEYLVLVSGRIRVRVGEVTRVLTAPASSSGPPTHPGEEDSSHPQTGVEIHIPRGTWHEWSGYWGSEKELDDEEQEEAEEVVVIERTDPADGDKAVFFWGLNGVILHGGTQPTTGSRPTQATGWIARTAGRILPIDWMITLALWRIFTGLDNWPVLVDFPGLLLGRGGGGAGNGGTRQVHGGTGERRVMALLLRKLDWAVTHVVLTLASWVGWTLGMRAVRREFMPEGEYEAWLAARRTAPRKKTM